MPSRDVAVGDRTLRVHDEGAPDGPVILYQHGTPQAGGGMKRWTDDAREHGARLIAYDRPGYGASTPAPGRTVASLAGLALFDVLGLNYFRGMGEDNIKEFGLVMAGREYIVPLHEESAAAMLHASGSELAEGIASLVSDVDRAVLDGEVGDFWADSMPATFAQGMDI
jgi:pimeloyl-ACP methyl ester carboxylesterase